MTQWVQINPLLISTENVSSQTFDPVAIDIQMLIFLPWSSHWICKNLCLYILCPWKICQVLVQNAKTPVDMCHLLHWTRYFAQIRVRYQQSPWSEWSSSQSGVTLESGKINSDWHHQSVNHFPIYCLFFHFLVFSIYANVIFCICHYFFLQRRLYWALLHWIHKPVLDEKVFIFKE